MVESDVKVIIVISGKRKSGKDYTADAIVKRLSEKNCIVIRVASPIKKHFCQKYNMDYTEIMTASQYKEQRREEMIKWGEAERAKNPSVFCWAVSKEAVSSGKPVWILSDARRPTDVEFFGEYAEKNDASFFSIRVSADVQTRESRGWKFTKGVDDVDSECALDEYKRWSHSFENSSSSSNVLSKIDEFCNEVCNML